MEELFEQDFASWQLKSLSGDENTRPTPEMIQSYGYSVEIHKVVTEDGYINTLHRMPPRATTSENGLIIVSLEITS